MLYLLIAVLMGFFLGLAYAFLARYLAGRAENPAWETLLLAAGLAAAALVYVLFALTGGASGAWMLRELAGLAVFGFIAWQGWRTSTLWLALGWGAHVLWDAALHWSGPGALYTPRWYVLLCIGFDLAVAVWIVLVRRGGAEAPRFRMPPVAILLLLVMLTASTLPCTGTAAAEEPAAPPLSPKAAWLQEHAVPLARLDPEPEDFADLAPVGKALEDVRLVFLGEATRGEATTFRLKTRLIRYLHESQGFDLLVFEGGFYDLDRAGRRLREGTPARDALGDALFPLYTKAESFAPLLTYLDAAARGPRPLEVAGMDPQLTGGAAGGELTAELRAALARRGIEPGGIADLAAWEGIVGNLATERYTTGEVELPSRRQRKAFQRTTEELRGYFSPASGADAGFWNQVLVNLETYAEQAWTMGVWDPSKTQDPRLHNLRDEQMADNLLWLARERYPDRKILVWTLTLHAARDLDRLTTGEADVRERFDIFSLTGDRIHKELGTAAYTLAITAAEGRVGNVYQRPYPLLPPTPGSFEALLAETTHDLAFIDLRNLPETGRWLRRPLIARPIAHKELLGIWGRHLDGLIWVRRVEAVAE